MKEKLQSIREMAAEAMAACADSRELDAIRVKYLGTDERGRMNLSMKDAK